MLKKIKSKESAEAALEVVLHSISNMLDKVLRASATVKGAKDDEDLCDARMHLSDAISSADNAMHMLKLVDKAVSPKRAKVKTGLSLTQEGLREFDPDYFDYFDPQSEGYEFYQKQGNDRDTLCRHLATWAFDDGDTKAALRDVKKAFGDDVHKIVKKKLKNRDHDT